MMFFWNLALFLSARRLEVVCVNVMKLN
uniref:Uncharacterized protein n=1 Tax=Arundo donax TaxID=35708 RepID=A0A0A9HL39_ARUDO